MNTLKIYAPLVLSLFNRSNKCNSYNKLITNHNIKLLTIPNRSFGMTGVQFTPISPTEKKILEWSKTQQLNERKSKVRAIAQQIWRRNNRRSINWANLTKTEAEQLWHDTVNDKPSEWELNEFYSSTLKQFVPWRYEELEKDRLNKVNKAIELIFNDLKTELDNSTIDNPVEISKNELTNLLIKKLKLFGESPNKQDVDLAWELRYSLPRISWIGDE